jgi:uncharacterized protein YdcH (DUF465 family)
MPRRLGGLPSGVYRRLPGRYSAWAFFPHEERTPMFPEHRELISQLKTTDHHFKTLFDRHNALDQKIKNMESHLEPGTHEEIETQKKEKLLLKDQLYVILQKAARSQGAPAAH